MSRFAELDNALELCESEGPVIALSLAENEIALIQQNLGAVGDAPWQPELVALQQRAAASTAQAREDMAVLRQSVSDIRGRLRSTF
ncbi:hypothetical protein [Actinoalloteichus fjordicus]|uniref:Uncharacterized protein n=1 Tax=Actinoalloteichus fjordicus TaxID=1612552 RepID=A0AAC9PQJ9_9PSEU|nr:hypothetical protein [Actinoalloteichus fjordicus]APU13088.1 hypothetical protein UA74_05060 [Actinoalloteichus fjordicus]